LDNFANQIDPTGTIVEQINEILIENKIDKRTWNQTFTGNFSLVFSIFV
jgi:hypothetical protein